MDNAQILANPPYFSVQEFAGRVAALRRAMAEKDLSACLISAPENVFYLTGLDHWGYFTPHILLVPGEGEMTLVTRAMESVTVATHVKNARFEGHSDSETAAERTGALLRKLGIDRERVGIEAWSSGMSHGAAKQLAYTCPQAHWIDMSGLVDALRMVKSAAEQDFMRKAALVSDAAARAAIEAIHARVTEREIAATCQHAMVSAGGTYPGFGPFIRSTARLGEEHTTWSDTALGVGDAVFLELSGCVARYHAPLGRLIHVGRVPEQARTISGICGDAFHAVCEALRPGALLRDVYATWQRVVDAAGLSHYRRHHCGYVVGIGVPPSWTGGNKVTGIRQDSELPVRTGMSFHVLSWLMDTGRGDFFLSNTVLLGDHGPEVLTKTPAGIIER